MNPVRVARVADEADRLRRGDARSGLQASREGDAVHAAAAVVVLIREVVVQVDIQIGRSARAVEVEHAAGARGARVEADAPRLRRQRQRVARGEDVDPLMRSVTSRCAEVV